MNVEDPGEPTSRIISAEDSNHRVGSPVRWAAHCQAALVGLLILGDHLHAVSNSAQQQRCRTLFHDELNHVALASLRAVFHEPLLDVNLGLHLAASILPRSRTAQTQSSAWSRFGTSKKDLESTSII